MVSWIIGQMVAFLLLVNVEDPAWKTAGIVVYVYYTIGLAVSVYKLSKNRPFDENVTKQLELFETNFTKRELDLRAQQVKILKYLSDVNTLVGHLISDNGQLKEQLTELMSLVYDATMDDEYEQIEEIASNDNSLEDITADESKKLF